MTEPARDEHPSEPKQPGTEADWPSRRPGLRDDITAALREHGMVHLGDQVPADEYDCCADAVLAPLYREWPWLQAEAEELEQARAELLRHAENESADAAAGSYAGRAERVEAKLRASEFTAKHWHQVVLDRDNIPAAHAIACIRAALKGETRPEQLGLDDDIHDAFHASRISSNAVETESVIVCTTACDEQHTYDWTCEQFAGISDEPPRTTPDNPPTSSNWTPPPPGDRREQLPDHILALINIPAYTSTACETAELLAAAVARHPAHADELRYWEQRQRQRCRINNKYTGVNCQHTETASADEDDLAGARTPAPPIRCLNLGQPKEA